MCVAARAQATQAAQGAGSQAGGTQTAESSTRAIIKSQHLRLPFTKDIQRIAVGDTDILSAELVTNREVLVLGKETGRTTLIIWFTDGTLRDYIFAVQRDLSLLQNALRRVNPSIEVEIAPDRDAIVLTGIVPNLFVSQQAEAIARSYLDAGDNRRGAARPLIAAPGAVPAAPGAAAPGQAPAAPGQPQAAAPQDAARLQGEVPPSGTIINLIQLQNVPQLPEEKIRDSIQAVGGQAVTIRRVLRGNVRDDTKDTLVLEGAVPNQVALVRILEIASQLFAGQTVTEQDIRVVADESGALTGRAAETQGQSQTFGFGNTGNLPGLGGGGGGGGNRQLNNQVQRNLARAKAIEVANGRILSFIGVSDLPQIRVDIRLLEVNRNKLLTFDPSSALLVSDFHQPTLSPASSATVVQGNQAARVGSVSGFAVQEVLSFLSGSLLNQVQFSGSHAAVDAAVSLLERQGIARTLSSPSLTVLSGEQAQFQVGGDVPVPVSAFAPFGSSASSTANVTTTSTGFGVFSAVDFVSFGVQLRIRPLVGDDDSITLDVEPRVVTPDATLTDTLRQTTGTNLLTTAFQTRALRTSSRLQDGQTLLIGGLTTNDTSRTLRSTPGVADTPGLGWLFKSFSRNEDSQELVVVVNPVIVRPPVRDAHLWAYPEGTELMRSIRGGLSPAPAATVPRQQ